MKQDVKNYLQEIGKRGGLKTKKRGRQYYKQIGKLGLAKRYKKPLPLDGTNKTPLT